MRNAGLEEAQAGIKIARRNINNLIYADDISLTEESEEEVKRLLMPIQPGCMWEGPYHLLSVCPHLHRQSCALMNTRP